MITPEKGQKQRSAVWVWDSIWLPAVVVNRSRKDCVLVRLKHGVTFPVKMANVVPRNPDCGGADIPSPTRDLPSNRDGRIGLWSNCASSSVSNKMNVDRRDPNDANCIERSLIEI